MMNALMPQGSSPVPAGSPNAPTAGAPPSASPPDLSLSYDKLLQAGQLLNKTQSILQSLAKLGDTVTPADVVKGSEQLVAGGLDPMGIAGMLSEMPGKPDQIAQWIAGHLQDVGKRQEQLARTRTAVGYELGVQSLKSIQQAFGSKGGASATSPTAPAPLTGENPLLPSSN